MSRKRILPPNFTGVPNVLIDHLMGEMSGSEFKVAIVICRLTFGWLKESDRITMTQLVRKTRLSMRAVQEAVKRLEDPLKIITRTPCVDGSFVYQLVVSDDDPEDAPPADFAGDPPANSAPPPPANIAGGTNGGSANSAYPPPAENAGDPPQNLHPAEFAVTKEISIDLERDQYKENPSLSPPTNGEEGRDAFFATNPNADEPHSGNSNLATYPEDATHVDTTASNGSAAIADAVGEPTGAIDATPEELTELAELLGLRSS